MADLRSRFIEDYAGGLLNISRQEFSTTGEVLSQDGLTSEGTVFVEDGSGVKTGLKLGVSLAEVVDPTTETGIVNVRFADRTYAKIRDLKVFTTAIASAQAALSEATSVSISNLETAFQLLEDDVSTIEENLQKNITEDKGKIQELIISQNFINDTAESQQLKIENLDTRVVTLETSGVSDQIDSLDTQVKSIELRVDSVEAAIADLETPDTIGVTDLDVTNLKVSNTALFSSRGGINNLNKTIISSYFPTPAIGDYSNTQTIGDAPSLQTAVGMIIGIDKARTDPGAIEFYKTRGASLTTSGAVQVNDALGALHFSGSNGVTGVLGGSFYCNISKNWDSSENSVWFRFRYAVPGASTLNDRLFIGRPFDQNDTTVGPNTIEIPFVPSTVAASSAGWDANNRLIKSSSSAKYKTQIEDLESVYAYGALNLRPVWYRSKTDVDNKDWSWYGLIAEEVAEIDPRLVHWAYAPDQYQEVPDGPNQYKRELKPDAVMTPEGVQYDRVAVLLLKVVKDQQEKIENLSKAVESLLSTTQNSQTITQETQNNNQSESSS